ncbi:uncharacterized protein LOC130716722 isoform X2 [Lotus japonicus]|uniref:uncharacterized protein LOC130716722 isoform X2 n=1 Tax=Lotus japonicus TaxID=34305 RepID=UPI002590F33D|nr:uncharacterized protein LOC130716722 isoform X2 [Lotus japonicus]
MDSHSQSELLHSKKRRREEKPEPLPSPEQDQEQSCSKKKRRKKKKIKEEGIESHEHDQVLLPEPVVVATAIPITLETPKEQGAEPIEATVVHPVPDQRPAKTHRKKKKKETVLEPQPEPEPELKETSNTDHSEPTQLCSVKKKKKRKGAESNEAVAELATVCTEPPAVQGGALPEPKPKEPCSTEHPRVCPEPPLGLAIPIDPEKNRKEAEPNESNAEHPRACPEPPLGLAIPIDPEKNKGENLTPTDENELNRRNRREELVALVTSDEKIVNPRDHLVPLKSIPGFVLEQQTQPGPVIPVCPNSASLIGQSQTIPVVDTEQKINKRSRMSKMKRKRMNSMPDKHNTEPPETKKRVLDREEPNKCNAKLPETLMLASNCHIDQAIPSDSNPAVPTNPEHKTPKKWKKRAKKKNVLLSEGGKSNEHNGQPTETPVQKSVSPINAPSIDPTLPTDQPVPIDLATPKHSEGKMSNAQRNNVLLSEGVKSNEQPTETPVQKSVNPIKAPSIDPTLPTDQPVPIDLATPKHSEGKMSKAQRRKKNKRALKSAWSESVHHSSDQNAKNPVQRTESLKLVEAKSVKAKSFMASRQHGHKLKYPSKDVEICFFCGEIGHSLGRCSVSRAGGGLSRFAKCLICHAQGHFSYNCTRHGHGLIQSCSYIHSGLQSSGS